MIYRVKCPKCSAKADALMKTSGTKGTYREAMSHLVAERIQCQACGFLFDGADGKVLEYELWYKTTLKGHVLWAVNEEHLNFLIEWLSGNMDKSTLNLAERASVEVLPKWLVTNKMKASEKLAKLQSTG